MDLAAVTQQLASLETQLKRMREGQEGLRRDLAELRISVTSADGLVTATVDARGQVTRVELDPRIYQRPDSRQLAAVITATIQQAAAEVMDRVLELTRPFVPDHVFRAHLGLDPAAARDHADELAGR